MLKTSKYLLNTSQFFSARRAGRVHAVPRKVEVVQAVEGFLTPEVHQLDPQRLLFGGALQHDLLFQSHSRRSSTLRITR